MSNDYKDKSKQLWNDFSKMASGVFSTASEASRNASASIKQKVEDFKQPDVDPDEFEQLKKRVAALEALLMPKTAANNSTKKAAPKKASAKTTAKVPVKAKTATKKTTTTAKKAPVKKQAAKVSAPKKPVAKKVTTAKATTKTATKPTARKVGRPKKKT